MGIGIKTRMHRLEDELDFLPPLAWDVDLGQGSIRKDAPSVVMNPRHPLGPGKPPGYPHFRAISHSAYGDIPDSSQTQPLSC